MNGGAERAGATASLGQLSFRLPRVARRSERTGLLALTGEADAPPASAYLPPSLTPAAPGHLVVLLHGAGGQPARTIELLRPYADERRLVLLAPKSTAATWDVIAGAYGPDVRNLDRLLGRVAALCPVTAASVGGFSDGASYALSLGLVNGDLFQSVVAFSPGFEAAPVRHGRPRFFLSHGVQDRILPIDRCSRRLVPALRGDGYHVDYEEFAGGHEIPAEIRRTAVEWLTGT